jgi:hypothetical protein
MRAGSGGVLRFKVCCFKVCFRPPVAHRSGLLRLAAHQRQKRDAHALALEVEGEGDARLPAVVERLDGDRRGGPDGTTEPRSTDAVTAEYRLVISV